jgi:hypothetical protein
MEGAVQNKFWEASSGEKAIDFCKFLTDAKDKESCYTTILNRAKAVMTTPEEMRWFCSMVEPGYHYRIPLPVLAHLIGEKLFNLKPTKESVAINSCYRPLPQLDKLLARWTKT